MRHGPGQHEPADIGHDILAYLFDHPEAHDTLEGIMEWWLLEQEIKRQTAQVREALADLIARGFVLEQQTSDGRTHYRVNRRKAREIGAYLKKR
jgi:predicted transcriptional regulator